MMVGPLLSYWSKDPAIVDCPFGESHPHLNPLLVSMWHEHVASDSGPMFSLRICTSLSTLDLGVSSCSSITRSSTCFQVSTSLQALTPHVVCYLISGSLLGVQTLRRLSLSERWSRPHLSERWSFLFIVVPAAVACYLATQWSCGGLIILEFNWPVPPRSSSRNDSLCFRPAAYFVIHSLSQIEQIMNQINPT